MDESHLRTLKSQTCRIVEAGNFWGFYTPSADNKADSLTMALGK